MGAIVKYAPPATARKLVSDDDPARLDPVRAEVAAMRTIAEAMATLTPEARARVTRWTGELFGAGAAAAQPASAAAAAGGGLGVGDLADFFDPAPIDQPDLFDVAGTWPDAPASGQAPEPRKEKTPVVSMIRLRRRLREAGARLGIRVSFGR